jgi:hypothetical protein
MKIIHTILLSILLTTSVFGFDESLNKEDRKASIVVQYQSDFPNIFRPITGFIKKILGKKTSTIGCRIPFATVKNVTLSNTVVENCSVNSKHSIEVYTETDYPDYIIYNYSVSGGNLLWNRNAKSNYGNKDKAIWDFTDVPAGEYTIEIYVDNGCGDCFPHVIKTVTVVDCQK